MVVRENEHFEDVGITGVYQSLQRAEEICGSSSQALLDAGVPAGTYRFSVRATNYYDE